MAWTREDDEGSGGSAAPEEDEAASDEDSGLAALHKSAEDVGTKQLPGLSISFMPKGSLLGGPGGGCSCESLRLGTGGSTKDEKKRKDKAATDMASLFLGFVEPWLQCTSCLKDKKDKKEEKEVRTPVGTSVSAVLHVATATYQLANRQKISAAST